MNSKTIASLYDVIIHPMYETKFGWAADEPVVLPYASSSL